MIKSDELYEVTISPKTIKHFRQYFPDIKMGDKIKVTGEQLSESSHVKIKYICDFCGAVFERIKYSEIRSGNINACKNCRTKKTIQTCQARYGVNHPMQDADVHRRSVEGHINNFGKEFNSCEFVNGVPISKVQRQICEELRGFTLNYSENGYYYDMFNPQLNLVIEYNGKGHDLAVRRGKVERDIFEARELKRREQIRQIHKLLIIEDSRDRLIHPKRFQEILPRIRQSVEDLKDYDIIQIE